MASVSLEKMTTIGACGSQGIRHNFRTSQTHQNPDIDSDLSRNNLYWVRGMEQPEQIENIEDRKALAKKGAAKMRDYVSKADELIPPQRIRKDRKTFLSVTVVAPRDGMTTEELLPFWEEARKAIEKEAGVPVLSYAVHADEVHAYTDHGEKKQSRIHAQYEIPMWVDGKGINGKAFYTRDLPNRLNQGLDEVCETLYHSPYRDGSQQKSRGKVELLKSKQLSETIADQEQTIARQEETIAKRDKAVKIAEKEAEALDEMQTEPGHYMTDIKMPEPLKRKKDRRTGEELGLYREDDIKKLEVALVMSERSRNYAGSISGQRMLLKEEQDRDIQAEAKKMAGNAVERAETAETELEQVKQELENASQQWGIWCQRTKDLEKAINKVAEKVPGLNKLWEWINRELPETGTPEIEEQDKDI